MIDGQPVEPACNRLLLVQARCVIPRGDLGFDFRIIRPPIPQLIAVRAKEHKFTPMMGRSHGIHAEPTTFGLKLAGAYAEMTRARARLVVAREEISTCAISGAIGTFANPMF